MNSKETIRKKILSYVNLIWGSGRIEQFDIVIRLMIEELTNELYLVQNSITNIDKMLLERLAEKLTPAQYLCIRPAHTILQLRTNEPIFTVNEQIPFYLNDVPEELKNKEIETIAFHPVADVRLFNIQTDNYFHHPHLYSVNNAGKMKIKATAQEPIESNSIWLGLHINKEIDDLQGLPFYINFPELSEIHDYYEVLPYTQLLINGKKIKLQQGFPSTLDLDENSSKSDTLSFYEKNYLTIAESIPLETLRKEALPQELKAVFDPKEIVELASELTPKYWVQLKFHHYILAEDLDLVTIALNTFPVSNKRKHIIKVNEDFLDGTISLFAGKGEKLLEIDTVEDSNHLVYEPHVLDEHKIAGTYHIEPVNSLQIQGLDIMDYMEQIIDLAHRERVAFSTISTDKISQTIRSISKLETNTGSKLETNEKKKYTSEIGRVLLSPPEDTMHVAIHYSSCHGELVNGISTGEQFAPQMTEQTVDAVAISLSDICGGKEFSDMENLLAINKYLLTSNDRIVTEDNIVSFCEIELGNAISKVEPCLTVKNSPRPKEGMIKTIEIRLHPSERHSELLQQKGLLRDLLVRMRKRSPDHYDYTLVVMPLEKEVEENILADNSSYN